MPRIKIKDRTRKQNKWYLHQARQKRNGNNIHTVSAADDTSQTAQPVPPQPSCFNDTQILTLREVEPVYTDENIADDPTVDNDDDAFSIHASDNEFLE